MPEKKKKKKVALLQYVRLCTSGLHGAGSILLPTTVVVQVERLVPCVSLSVCPEDILANSHPEKTYFRRKNPHRRDKGNERTIKLTINLGYPNGGVPRISFWGIN